MLEKDMQSSFNKWCQHNWQGSASFELKLCKLPTFNLAKIADHQIANLKLVKHNKLIYKISDSGDGQKPFDSICLEQAGAYLVLMFYKPRQPKVFYMIDIDTIQGLLDDGIKSIKECDAVKLAAHSGILK